MKNNYIGQAWLVLVLALCFGAALAGVETWLKPKIDANKLAATLDQIANLVPDANAAESARIAKDPNWGPVTVAVGEGDAAGTYEAFRAMDAGARQVGWVIKASGKGFADKIELLIGLDANAQTITGLHVLDQKETPGLGNKITVKGDPKNQGFLWQFFHHRPRADQPLAVTKASPKADEPGAANKIKAVTGATISSRSVCDIINEALSGELRQKLAAEAKKAAAATRKATPSTRKATP